MPIISTAPFRSPSRLPPKRSPSGYVRNTGAVIVRRFRQDQLDPSPFPASLLPATRPLPGESRPRRPSSMQTCLSTSPDWRFEPLSSTPPSNPFLPTSASIITSASTAPKRPTDSDNSAGLAQQTQRHKACKFGGFRRRISRLELILISVGEFLLTYRTYCFLHFSPKSTSDRLTS